MLHEDNLFAVPTAAQDMCHEPAVYTKAQLCASHEILRMGQTTETTRGKLAEGSCR